MFRLVAKLFLGLFALFVSGESKASDTSHGRNPQVSFFEDRTGSLSIDAIKTRDDDFKALSSQTPNFSITDSTIWLRIDVRASRFAGHSTIFAIQNGILDEVEIFRPTAEGYKSYKTGRSLPFSSREIKSGNLAFLIDADQSLQGPFFVRVRGDDALRIPFSFHDPAEFYQLEARSRLVQGLYLGLIFAIAIFNLFLFAFTSTLMYLSYALGLIALNAGWVLSMTGLAFEYLWPDSPKWEKIAGLFAVSLGVALQTHFTQAYLRTKTRMPNGHRFLNSCIGWFLAVAIAMPFMPDSASILAVTFGSPLSVPGPVYIAVYRARQGAVTAKYYLAATAVMFLGSLGFIMGIFGAYSNVWLGELSFLVGMVVQVTVLNLGLAAHFREMDAERQDAQRAAVFAHSEADRKVLAVVKQEKEALRVRVAERTSALRSVNQRLRRANRFMNESLKFANFVQASSLTGRDKIAKVVPNSFVIWKPMGLVGGDFYWIGRIADRDFIAVGDCVGHGVAGALIAMQSLAMLSDVVHELKDGTAGEILSAMNERFKRAYGEKLRHDYHDLGLDLGLCILDRRTCGVSFAGAHSNLLVRIGSNLYEISGDRAGIGFNHSTIHQRFQTHTIDTKGLIAIYLFSDGYQEQGGGDKKLPFGRKRFRDLIAATADVELAKQGQQLLDALEMHMGKLKQRDDITVVGFELPWLSARSSEAA